jgi:hypothetical protein
VKVVVQLWRPAVPKKAVSSAPTATESKARPQAAKPAAAANKSADLQPPQEPALIVQAASASDQVVRAVTPQQLQPEEVKDQELIPKTRSKLNPAAQEFVSTSAPNSPVQVCRFLDEDALFARKLQQEEEKSAARVRSFLQQPTLMGGWEEVAPSKKKQNKRHPNNKKH